MWRQVAQAVVLAAALAALPRPAAARWWWEEPDYGWPATNDRPVTALGHPTVESVFRARQEAGAPDAPYRFAAFGDQRALADGEWQALMRGLLRWTRAHGQVQFLVDTGDIVDDGRYTDQFARLSDEILSILPDTPYLVGVGNHETHNNDDPGARRNTAAFLEGLDPGFSAERMYYRKDLGPATFLFLDTNDLVYGDAGERDECPGEALPGTRAAAQVTWLEAQLHELRAAPPRLVVAVLHHPFVQSSAKHRGAARSLWSLRVQGTPLPDALLDGGVDVVLTGHTHTFERFVLRRDDGHAMHVVNLSGRPRGSAFGLGAGLRRATDIRGAERGKLGAWGWKGLDRWEIEQVASMPKDAEADQFAVFTVEPDGSLTMELRFLDDTAEGGTRGAPPVRLH